MTRQEVYDHVKEEYGVTPEYLWADSPDSAIFRNPDGRWFGIVMEVSRAKLGLSSDEPVEILNVKADPVMIDALVQVSGYHRAYHMNKRLWITIRLDGSVPGEQITNLIGESYELTRKKKKVKKNRDSVVK